MRNVELKMKHMEKNFIQPHEMTKEMLENHTGARFLYERIKSVAEKQALTLDCKDLPVGHEVFFGARDKSGKPCVVSALCKGYRIDSDFCRYEVANGEVNCSCNPIYVDADGNEYAWPDDVIGGVYGNRKDAEDDLEEIKNEE